MNSNERHCLPPSHQKMIEVITRLPEFTTLVLWRAEQVKYLKVLQHEWEWIGARIDYLQRQQLGYIDSDPADKVSDPRLRNYLIIYSNYYFHMLQVVIAGFKAIKPAFEKRNRVFDFINPRDLFVEMCKEMSQGQLAELTSREVGKGITVTELRKLQSFMGKFYRGSLPKHEIEAFCQEIEDKGGLAWFSLISIYQHFRPYLQKTSTSIGFAWKNFSNSQRELSRHMRSGEVGTIRWNCGRPVCCKRGLPIQFSDP